MILSQPDLLNSTSTAFGRYKYSIDRYTNKYTMYIVDIEETAYVAIINYYGCMKVLVEVCHLSSTMFCVYPLSQV